jgi:type I restriction enzyme R subunit
VEYVTVDYFGMLGITTKSGADLDDADEWLDATRCLSQGRLIAALHRLNPSLPHEVREQVIRTLSRAPHPTLIQNNRWFHMLLTDGVEVEYRDPASGETRGGRARLIDFENSRQNDLLVVRQLTVTGPSGKSIRPDLTVFLNGLPIAVIELKDPTDTSADLNAAIGQLGRYMQTAPDLFMPNLLLVVSDGLLTRVGSITSGPSRFMPWRPAEGGAPTLEALIRGLFEPSLLLDYLRSCVAFEEDERGEIAKKIAGYHQFRAVRRTRASVLNAMKPSPTPYLEGMGIDRNRHPGRDCRGPEARDGTGASHPCVLDSGNPCRNDALKDSGENLCHEGGKGGDGRGGVVWHTQGSGKSLTMLMLAGALVREPVMVNPTIVMVTDRNDLDDQLFGTFAAGRALLRQAPIQAESREHLKELLDRAAGGVVFTTIHKLTEAHGVISERANVVVMADEAHRSQYGFVEGGARWMRGKNAAPRWKARR